jgi:hypothetical protein
MKLAIYGSEKPIEEKFSLIKVNISPIFASHLVFIPRALQNHP